MKDKKNGEAYKYMLLLKKMGLIPSDMGLSEFENTTWWTGK